MVEFFNGTPDDTVIDGLQFAVAYSNELQSIPGFEVVPADVVRAQMNDMGLSPAHLQRPENRRRLAAELGVDAIVMGAVTEYSPYYPPRLGLQVDWHSANPCYYPIPPGYGLPWGTTDEEEIPESLVYEAEMALAKAQLATQTPDHIPPPAERAGAIPAAAQEELPPGAGSMATEIGQSPGQDMGPPNGVLAGRPEEGALPPDWPDPRGFVPPGPMAERPLCVPSNKPVMSHIRNYSGNDAQFTAALRNFYNFRDEARFGGWQSYLQRSDDFIRFCCYTHISEMLTARGGAGKTQLAWRWSSNR